VRTSHRSALNNARNTWCRCGLSSRLKVKYGTTKLHSSSLTSLG
jgi:hypothetical protein